jgi:hypothetical protein
VTSSEFEKVYEQSYQKALDAVYASGIKSKTVAEDAVQNAAVYFLERLDSYTQITPSLFIQMVVGRAKNTLRDHNNRVEKFEVAVGTIFDLSEIVDGKDDEE